MVRRDISPEILLSLYISILLFLSTEKITSSVGAVDLSFPQAVSAIVIANSNDPTLNNLPVGSDVYFSKCLFISYYAGQRDYVTNSFESKPTNREEIDVVDGHCEFAKFSHVSKGKVISIISIC